MSNADTSPAATSEQAATDTDAVQAAPTTTLNDSGQEAKTDVDLNLILNVDVDLALEVGKTKLSVRDQLKLNHGSVVELDRIAGEPLDVLVNGMLIARGEVVVVNDNYGIRLTEIVAPADRIKHIR